MEHFFSFISFNMFHFFDSDLYTIIVIVSDFLTISGIWRYTVVNFIVKTSYCSVKKKNLHVIAFVTVVYIEGIVSVQMHV